MDVNASDYAKGIAQITNEEITSHISKLIQIMHEYPEFPEGFDNQKEAGKAIIMIGGAIMVTGLTMLDKPERKKFVDEVIAVTFETVKNEKGRNIYQEAKDMK